ncbi:MAG: hypothetical protein KKF77_07065 [Proteobacteria bacterium]|nr:hypothetical protein [Pseudomonadota bacterium]
MTMLVAIPYFTEPPDVFALGRLLRKIRSATTAAIHVFHPPGFVAPAEAGVVFHAVSPVPEERSALPKGWLATAQALAVCSPGTGALLVDAGNPHLSTASIARAIRKMAQEVPSALISVVPSGDHPCQWESPFDIFSSQIFVLADPAAQQVAKEVASALGTKRRPIVSKPFAMPSIGLRLDARHRSPLYEWLPAQGVLAPAPTPAEGAQGDRQLAGRIFLWRDTGYRCRQVVFEEADLAALPLLSPVSAALARIVRDVQSWEVQFSPGLSSPMRFQVYPLPRAGKPYGTDGLLRWPLLPPGAGDGKSGRVHVAPVAGAHLMVFNILEPSRLPAADLILPYISDCGGWEVDPATSARTNTHTKTRIFGRQSFPMVFEMEGSLLGLSAEALRAPLQALAGAETLLPLELGEDEAKGSVLRSASPAPAPAQHGGTRAVPRAASAQLWEIATEKLTSLEGMILRAEQQQGSRRDAGSALQGLGEILESLVLARQAYFAACMENAVVGQFLQDKGEPEAGFLPVYIFSKFHETTPPRFRCEVESAVFSPLMDTLLNLWERSLGVTTLEALASMSSHAKRAGLASCWDSGLPLALARKGFLREAGSMLDQAYGVSPWLCGDYAAIAFHCLRPQFLLEEYLSWFTKDADAGRLSNQWLLHYCEALAVNCQLRCAVGIIAQAYRKREALENCFAVAHWWRYMLRGYAPGRALAGFERDKALGRLSGDYPILHAVTLAAAGRLERAIAAVEREYSTNASVRNGYAMVGWFYHFVRRRDADKAMAMIEKDNAAGRLDPTLRNYYLACLCAFKQDTGAAEELVAQTYAESSHPYGHIAQLGLMHWLRHKDPQLALAYFERDHAQGRLGQPEMRLAYAALLHLAGKAQLELTGELLESARPSELNWDVCATWLRRIGFRQKEVAGLMTSSLRRANLALR